MTIIVVGDFFVRESKGSPLEGPYSFKKATATARYMSRQKTGKGVAQVVTFLGDRAGDPVTFPARLFVESIYVLGKKFIGGRVAQYHSDHELITQVPGYPIT